MSSSLLFEISHIGRCDRKAKEFKPSQGANIAPIVVLDKDGYALDALVLDEFQKQIIGIFLQIFGSQFDSCGRIDVLNVLESKVVAIDKEQYAYSFLGRIVCVVLCCVALY